jgi:hypothetical protein
MVDMFNVEYQIKARIADKLPEVKAIYSINEQINDAQFPTPAVFTIFDGDNVSGDTKFHDNRFVIHQRWSIALYLPARYTIAEIGNAGSLLGEITRVLHGWVPNGCASPLMRTEALPVERNEHYIVYQQHFAVDIYAEKSEVF